MTEMEYDYTPSGPEVEKADHYDATFSPELDCGVHITSFRADGTIICETILTAELIVNPTGTAKTHPDQKATRRN